MTAPKKKPKVGRFTETEKKNKGRLERAAYLKNIRRKTTLELPPDVPPEFLVEYLQRERQKVGSKHEAMWRKTMEIWPIWSRKLLTGYDGTPFDFIAITPKASFAMELKHLIKYKCGYSSIRKNQREGLDAFENDTRGSGCSLLVVEVDNGVTTQCFLLLWDLIREGVLSGRTGSFDVRWGVELDKLPWKITEISVGRANVEWVWDISCIAGPPREEYREQYDEARARFEDIVRGGPGYTPAERRRIEEAFLAAKSALLEKAGLTDADLEHAKKRPAVGVDKPQRRKIRRPTQRRPPNGPIRNSETWGKNKYHGQPMFEIDGELCDQATFERLSAERLTSFNSGGAGDADSSGGKRKNRDRDGADSRSPAADAVADAHDRPARASNKKSNSVPGDKRETAGGVRKRKASAGDAPDGRNGADTGKDD